MVCAYQLYAVKLFSRYILNLNNEQNETIKNITKCENITCMYVAYLHYSIPHNSNVIQYQLTKLKSSKKLNQSLQTHNYKLFVAILIKTKLIKNRKKNKTQIEIKSLHLAYYI